MNLGETAPSDCVGEHTERDICRFNPVLMQQLCQIAWGNIESVTSVGLIPS